MPTFSFQQILPFYRLQNLQKNQASFVHDRVRRGVKWQDLLEEEKIGCNAFRTGGKIHLKEKGILGLGAL